MKVGFIGLGTMGLPMARHLVEAGYETYVVSRSRGPIETAVAFGAFEKETPKSLIETVDVVMTCLPTPDSIKDVYDGETGLLAGASRGKVIIDHSTVNPATNEWCYQESAKKGTAFVDAPISGGPMGAEAGTLTIMCGCDEEVFPAVQPVLEAFGEYIIRVGQIGSGTTVKLLNNMLIGVHQSALAECYVMAEKAGVDPAIAYDVIKRSAGFSKSMDWAVDAILDRNFDARFSINLLDKDIKLALGLAEELNMPLDVVKVGAQKVAHAKEKYGHQDVSAIIRPLEEATNSIVKRRTKENH
ncbi:MULTISPECIES: NAD(P)-dependent oxidoreductase [Shouchella]|uniref:NAD(P)-dependent oxidoreductase n=2 Tax=Shouchella TaxID=2893057 RepID=A0ABY7W8P8_9BACI|nr:MULTISPECIES: NAD(P)-dependent oxidoreductase [Shouchella]MED4127430.1 NAD(P)-dependent oxidoreductase [Shouchella miscanthi]WDF03898.1 NAD(P)-dependent oxidoreductase [Shouchella hunanensis]GAF24278.1 2-hydroxy-3-oxopropionate reductase [Bacillus sp. JCM 19047]